MYRFSLLTLTLFSIFSVSCNPERLQYNDQLKQQMADMRVKRVTNADLNEAVNSWGAQIVSMAEKEAASKEKSGANCDLSTLPKTQALAKRYGMTISLQGPADVRNPKLTPKERGILDAYLYNAEQKLPQSSNIQPVGDSLFVYNAVVPAGHVYNQCFDSLVVWRLAFPKREIIRHLNVKK